MDPIDRREYEEFKTRMEDEHKRMNVRLKMVEETGKQIHQLTISVEKLALSVQQIVLAQNEHSEQIEQLESRDGEKWRAVTGYVVTAVVGIVIGFIFMQIGMNLKS